MKKYLLAFLISGAVPMQAMALVHFEYGLWDQTAGGNVTIPPAPAGVFPDTGTSQNMMVAEIDLPIPLIPNLRITNTAMHLSSGADTVDANVTEALVYYQPLDNFVTLRYGAGLLLAPMDVNVSGTPASLPGLGAMYYVGVAINPTDSLSIGYQMTGPVVAAINVSSTDLYVQYKVFAGLGVKAGLRTQAFSVSDGTNSIGVDASGSYISAVLHF